jgi:hypothetical protein
MRFIKTIKILEFFLKYAGKLWEKPELEPEYLTSWSRCRTKMDRLRNTGHYNKYTVIENNIRCFVSANYFCDSGASHSCECGSESKNNVTKFF